MVILPPVAKHGIAAGHPDPDAGIRIEFLALQRTEGLRRAKRERGLNDVRLADAECQFIAPGEGTRRTELQVVVTHFGLIAQQPRDAQIVLQGHGAQVQIQLEVAEKAIVFLEAAHLGAAKAARAIKPQPVDIEEHVLQIRGYLHILHALGTALITQVQAQAHAFAPPLDAGRHTEVHRGVLVPQVLVLGHQSHVIGQVQAHRPVRTQRQSGTSLHRESLQGKCARNRVSQHEGRLVWVDPSAPGAAPAIIVSITEVAVEAHGAKLAAGACLQSASQHLFGVKDIAEPTGLSLQAHRYIHVSGVFQHESGHVPLLRPCRSGGGQSQQHGQPGQKDKTARSHGLSRGEGFLSGMKSASELFVSWKTSMPPSVKSSLRVTHLPE